MPERSGATRASLLIMRYLLVAIALASSLFSVGLFMAGIGENNIPLVTEMWLLYFVSAFVIGACLPHWWYSAVAVSWLPLMLLPMIFLGFLRGETTQQNSANVLAAIMFALSPCVALAAGYLGGKVSSVYLRRLIA